MRVAQQPPTIINNRYRVGPELISGSVALLYSATALETGESVALLLAEPPSRLDSIQRRKLLQPIQGLIPLLHPHLLHVRDVGLDGSYCFVVTDLRGRPLRELLESGATPLKRAVETVWQLAQGLSALHAQGIYEIDLRPERIIIEGGERNITARAGDVGIRNFLWSLGYLDTSGNPLFQLDPRYAAPEQLKQTSTGPATDVYTLALLLFEMIAGHIPFEGRTPAETRAMQLSAPVPLLQPLRGQASGELQSFIEQAMAKHPSLRFKDMNSFSQALVKLMAALPQHESTPPAQGHMFQTTLLDQAIDDLQSTRPKPVPPPPSALEAPDFLDRETNPMVEGQDSEDDDKTLQVPGRARLLIGQSERKKVILLTHLPATLGRADPNRKLSPDIDLSPYDPKRSISRKHARIIREGDLFYIEDLKSRNKTWLGELELTPYERQLLRRHDTIQMGLLEVIFEY
jgi:serine/threonine protein kinase